MNVAELTFDTAVICDDVRREDTGKHIFIGVYTDDFVTREFPVNISFAVYGGGQVTRGGTVSGYLTIEDTAGGVLYRSPEGPGAEFVEGRFSLTFYVSVSVHRESELRIIIHLSGRRYDVTGRRVLIDPQKAVPENS